MLYFLRVHVAWREGSKVGVETPLSLLSFCDGTGGHHPPPPPSSPVFESVSALNWPQEGGGGAVDPSWGGGDPCRRKRVVGFVGCCEEKKGFFSYFSDVSVFLREMRILIWMHKRVPKKRNCKNSCLSEKYINLKFCTWNCFSFFPNNVHIRQNV